MTSNWTRRPESIRRYLDTVPLQGIENKKALNLFLLHSAIIELAIHRVPSALRDP